MFNVIGYNAVSLGGSQCFEEMQSCHLQGSIIHRPNCLILEDESATFLPNAETDHPTTKRHIPEDLNPQVLRCQDSQPLLHYLWSLQGNKISLYSDSSRNDYNTAGTLQITGKISGYSFLDIQGTLYKIRQERVR